MSKITFVLTLYKPKESEVNWWIRMHKEIVDLGHQFIVLNDNENLKIENDLFEFAEIINNKKNIGKFQSIIQSKEKWKNDFLKVLDPDDFISLSGLKEVEKLLVTKDIYRMPFKRIKEIPNDNSFESIEKIYEKKSITKHGNTLGNAWTILPTWPFFEEGRLTKNRIDYDDDQLLGNICLSANVKIIDIKIGFYLYLFENGISNKKNILKYLNLVEGTLIEYKRLKDEFEYENNTGWPNFTYYKALANKNIIKPSVWIKSRRRIKELKKHLNS